MTMVLVRGRKPDATDLLRDSGLHTLPAAVRIDALTVNIIDNDGPLFADGFE